MELLNNFKQHGYFTSSLYNLLEKKKLVDVSAEIIPSEYLKQMNLTPEQRLQTLNGIVIDNLISTRKKQDKAVLAFTPRLLVFQNFKPNEKLVAKFTVKNISQAPTYLNMVYKESSYFSVKLAGGQMLSRLAPGISVSFHVTLSPVQYEDYVHRITFYTDVDQYVLPLIAMGPRPMFNFPDEVCIPPTPLKVQNEFIMTIQNVGILPNGFTIKTKVPFSARPKSATLKPGEKVEICVSIKTLRLGEVQGFLHAVLETGENFRINVCGTTYTVSVELEKQIVRFAETYNSMARQQTFRITNKSPHLLTYMCMKNRCISADFDDKLKLATTFYEMKQTEAAKCNKLVLYDVISSEQHDRVYTRIFFDEIQSLVADQCLFFQNTHFSMEPVKGNLWPNKSTELTVTFCPKEIGDFESTLYLDIDGVNERMPLKMVGTSLPPSINLNLETLDMDLVYINKVYNYEIVAMNKGHINGVIAYKELPPLFESIITCTPELHCLKPGDKEVFVISFRNSNQGPYFEELNFVIRDTDVVLKLYIKGEIIYPSVIFSVPCLDYGIVSLGVPTTLEVDVINESIVDVKASLKIASDGPEVSSITLEDYSVNDRPKPKVPEWPREFNIEPCNICIEPESRLSLKVTLIANLKRANKTSLDMELDKSDSPPIVLPIIFDARVPEVTPSPDIQLQVCFVDYPYPRDVYFMTKHLWGYFVVEEPDEESTLQIEVNVKDGLIEPNSTIHIPIVVKTSVLGHQQYSLKVHLFGLPQPLEICHVTCCGVRPIITCSPASLHWGQVKLLMKSQKILNLCNDSPLHVNYKVILLNRDGRWKIEDDEGTLQPESDVDLVLSLFLVDALNYTNKAIIQVENMKDIYVPLSANGYGCSIVVGDISDKILLKPQFTKTEMVRKVTMVNLGTRIHALDWSERFKKPTAKVNLPPPFFTLEPRSLKIAAGEKVELTITASSNKPQTVTEVWYLIGSIEGINKKEMLMERPIIVEFVDPKLEISSHCIEFQYDYGPYSEFYKLTEIVTIKNVSKLPVDINLTVRPPFAIIDKHGSYRVSSREANLCCCIRYDKDDINMTKMLAELGPHKSKIFVDYLTFNALEPLRQDSLSFFRNIDKIKMAFNLTHEIRERLEHEEVMKFQLLFDTSKHTTLKSKIYVDVLKIKYEGLKQKDHIKLVGKINFPNILVLSPKVDFRCILNDSIQSKTIPMENVTPLLVCFRFQWKKCTISYMPEPDGLRIRDEVESILESEHVHQYFGTRMETVSATDKLLDSSNESNLRGNNSATTAMDWGEIKGIGIDPETAMKIRIMKKVAPMLHGEYSSPFEWEHKFGKIIKYNQTSVNDVLVLQPHRGLLKPEEMQFVHIIFRPKRNINVKAILECEVLGGPSESIVVTGQSSDLRYELSTRKVNFKIRPFAEVATEELVIRNIAPLAFEYMTYLNEPKFENELEGTILEIRPPEKILEQNEEEHALIVMRPGVVGYFERKFLLEIGYFPHIEIQVFGWGVIPQVYLSSQRRDPVKFPEEIGYLAIALLTPEYLDAVREFFNRHSPYHQNSPVTDKCFEDPELFSEWYICSGSDKLPSIMDIELAIERYFVINHIKLRPDVLTQYSSSKMHPIPGFITMPCLVDFGVVITGSVVQVSVDVTNYGPTSTKLIFSKGFRVPCWLSLKICGRLEPGETGKLEVTFSPTSEIFPELEQNVELNFSLEVPYGVTIPLAVYALCAVPYLTTTVTSIEFGSVRCGNKIICSIPLKNIGKPTCIWYATLKLKASGANPMVILDSSGKYEPGEGGWLSIAFKPTIDMQYEGMLIFRCHMNPTRKVIPVRGQGIVPQLHVIGPHISFPPTLPWAKTTTLYFGLMNPCPFPIELIIPHIDKKWTEEDATYQLLYKYYNKSDEMLVPAITPGDELPAQILDFKTFYLDLLKKNQMQEEAAMKSAGSSKGASTAGKKGKASPKDAKKSAREVKEPKEVVARKFRTQAEIISDVMNEMRNENIDPLRDCLRDLHQVPSQSATDPSTKGILIFFHGSPDEEMQCQEIAYTVGKRLSIPTINIDFTIVEALCVSECTAKESLESLVEEFYRLALKAGGGLEDTSKMYREAGYGTPEYGSGEYEYEPEDKFMDLLNKLETIARCKKLGTNPRAKPKESKKSVPSVGSSLCGGATLFPQELLEELLTDYFSHEKFNRGFVLDTLTSFIFKGPPTVLTTVLKCKRSIINVHLVLCQSDFYKWAQAYEDKLNEIESASEVHPKVYTKTEIWEIIEDFEDMSENEYENADEELKSVYITYGLEDRRRKYQEKCGLVTTISSNKVTQVSGVSKQSVTLALGNHKKPKKDESKGVKQTNEYIMMNAKYNDYVKNTYDNLINIANNWMFDTCDMGFPLLGFSGQVLGADKKKSKGKSSMVHNVPEEILPSTVITDRGFPLTLVMCPCLQYKPAIVNMFVRSPVVRAALSKDETENILVNPARIDEYSQLLPKTFPPICHEPSLTWRFLEELPIGNCGCNQLTELIMLNDTTQDCVIDILANWHCTCGKKVASGQTSTSVLQSTLTGSKGTSEETSELDSTVYPLPLNEVKSLSELPERLVLQPGDLMRCKYSFSPTEEGNFNVKRYVELSGWPDSRIVINASGICDLPRIDSRPKKMFQNFVRRTVEDKIYKHTFLDDRKEFEFGPIFIGKQRIYQEEYTIDLRNCSLLRATITIEFISDTITFEIDKTSLELEPGCSGTVSVSAAPETVALHTTQLLFCIKNNPDIVAVDIVCNGVTPVLEILPLSKSIDYGKLLLYRRKEDRFIVKNDSILPIMWKIRNPEDFLEDFIILHNSGIVHRHENQVVPITYIACTVGIVSRRPLIIDIYDEEGRGDPMIIDILYLLAECYDVLVETCFENLAENFLNYGNVKVNSTEYREMYLVNRGMYNIYFKLKKVKKFPEPALLKTMFVSNEYGIIAANNKMTAIEFEITPETSVNLVNVPAYNCSLLDGCNNQVLVAKFPICVTIASFYNTFTLFPLGELNFDINAVGTGVSREVILNNTSKCPFTFEIVLPEKYQIPPDMNQAKLKDNKIKQPPLNCGNFVIANSDNLLPPGTSRTIPIEFYATAAKRFEETIKFIISDTCPAEEQGVPLTLVGVGGIPTLDIWNLETTFREHLIVKSMSEYAVPVSTPHCVFVEDSVTLHFFRVKVQTSFTASIDLYNNGLVPCVLTMQLHYQTNSNANIFSLDKYETTIAPLQHKNLGIIFTPKALEEYRAVLEIKLKLLQNQTQSFRICLIGEGNISRIRMIQPSMKQSKISTIQLPVTCLGSVTQKKLMFKNISSVKSLVDLQVINTEREDRTVFWLTVTRETEKMLVQGSNDQLNDKLKLELQPDETPKVLIHFNPVRRGRTSCDVALTIDNNPFEYFTVMCEAEAFMEDVILIGLEMLPLDYEDSSSSATYDSRQKSKSAIDKKKKASPALPVKKKKISQASMKPSETSSTDQAVLKYLLNFGGCELNTMQRRSVIMVNNSEKLYKFSWLGTENLLIKPSVGYISPGEEKDLEIVFFSTLPLSLRKEPLSCSLLVVGDETLIDVKGATWDNRQCHTIYDNNPDLSLKERRDQTVKDEAMDPSESMVKELMFILVSATTEYTKYSCKLKEEKYLKDTFIYQKRSFEFTVTNTGSVTMKINWRFIIDEEFPSRLDKIKSREMPGIAEEETVSKTETEKQKAENEESKITLFSCNAERDSVDTWLEVDFPFTIEPVKRCLLPSKSQKFTVTFAPLNAFHYKTCLKSEIDNLDPYDQNVTCKINAKSLIPYCHLDVEFSDYLTAGRRKEGVVIPKHTTVLEFNVVGSGCYTKSFNLINPITEGYEFIFEMVLSEKPELMPMHCDKLKGYIEGGTTTDVTFTFAPTAPGVYESQWKFKIPKYLLVMNLLVVGLVREPVVNFVPTILLMKNSLVGFTTNHVVHLKNHEKQRLNFQFKGNSLCNESGKTPVIVEPEEGILKPNSETPIRIIYTPIQDGPLSFKIFCSVTYMEKFLTLCVNALSQSIKPKVTYKLIGNEHLLTSEAYTNIHLDQTASTYERTVPFTVKNDGSAAFVFNWHYNCSGVKKYLTVRVEPKSGHVAPGDEVNCTLYFHLKKVPVEEFPVSLTISDGPEYSIALHANIEKPSYHFSCNEYNFGKCIINAPDATYKRTIAFFNDDSIDVTADLNFANLPELFIHYQGQPSVAPGERLKITIYFRPKQVKEYEFTLQFWVNSLCEHNIIIKGEGVPLLFDLYQGCQKSFDMGPVKVGEKIVREIEVMNHSKVPIEATLVFKEMYPVILDDVTNSEATSVCLSPSVATIAAPRGASAAGGGDAEPTRCKMLQYYKDDKVKEQIAMDIQNALSSLKVVPNKCVIKPHRKFPLKLQFKPVGMISQLNVQLNMRVLSFERPLVRISGSATGMSMALSQNSLQFGRVRKRGCKILKVMLLNKGDFGARFWWQPLISDEFTIAPMYGNIAAHTNVTFTITFRPKNHNPFIKVWANCNIENYKPLELAMYATCIDLGNVQNQTIYFDCPVRENVTERVIVTNPTDEMWLVLSELADPTTFETLKEFNVEPNSTFTIPIQFKPRTMGAHETQVLFSPLGGQALFLTLMGRADHPSPNGTIEITVAAKESRTIELKVFNITEFPETYSAFTEVVQIKPDKFDGFYDVSHADTVMTWGEAAATFRWTYACYSVAEMQFKVMFVIMKTREYQYYIVNIQVIESDIVDTLRLECRARESLEKELNLTNSLSVDADFVITSPITALTCPDTVRISKKSNALVTLTYSPLVVGEEDALLEVYNMLTGTYLYKLSLTCLPAKEKELHITTCFGSNVQMRLRVQNRTDQKAEFRASVSRLMIMTEKDYYLGPSEKGKFLVFFEPTEPGVQTCRVSFLSPTAGEFVYVITGTALEPKPQGPIEIRAGGVALLLFKNVFEETRTFKITVDALDFFVKNPLETLKSKKDMKIPIYMAEKPAAGSGWAVMPTGCLTIEPEPNEHKVQWTYFLQGTPLVP